MGKIKGISHITLICKDLEKSAELFCELFGCEEVYSSEKKNFSISKEKFLLVGDLWIALMEGEPLDRSYNHIAFHVEEVNLHFFETKINALGLEMRPTRPRKLEEGKSIYFYDYDNHLFELHTGTLSKRLTYYQTYDKNITGIFVRLAEESEMHWVNQCYDKVGFIHSNFNREFIAIAEFEGEKVGLGRLVKIDENNLELGGMYVLESFRGKGIASEVVRFLLNLAEPFPTVYCIPFEYLIPFYTKCGFTTCTQLELVPNEILDKYQLCKVKYTNPTSLMMH